jgi:hypothetical protein
VTTDVLAGVQGRQIDILTLSPGQETPRRHKLTL